MDIVNLTAPGSAASIEPATWRDLNALRRLEQICFPQDAWPLFDLISILTFSNAVRLKATADGNMVGFIGADIRRNEKIAWIATIGVLPEYRRLGIGAALLTACEAQLKVPRVRLSVRKSNQAAINLYHRFGYSHVGDWVRYYTDGEDALVLEKYL